MSSIDHIFLYTLLFFVFYIFAQKSKYCKTEKDFWKLAVFPILLFVLIEGCRYGRGVDYLWYKYRFEHISPIDESQKIFLWLMQTLDFLGLNYVGAFMAYALIFITGTIYFVRNTFRRDMASWMYLLILFSMLVKSESMIRQYVAMPFVFLSYCAIVKRKWWLVVFWIFIAFGIHSGTIVALPFVLLFYFFYKKTISVKIIVPLLFLAYYIIPSGFFSDMGIRILGMFNLASFSGTENLSHYIEDSDRWLGADSFLEDSQQSVLTKTLQFIFDASVLIISYYALKKCADDKISVFYNVISLGFVLDRLFFGYEIFQRMTGQLYIYWFIPLGYSIYVYAKQPYSREKKRVKWFLILAISYQILFYSRFIFLNPKAEFIWT